MNKKLVGTLAAALALLVPNGMEAATVQEPETVRSEAVELARAGSYSEALVLLREVANSGYDGAGFWADYMTVLSWAGQEQELVTLAFEHYAGDFSLVPDYALLPIARAYEHTGDLDTAIKLYQQLASHGSTQSELSAANLLARSGNVAAANEIYERLRVNNSYDEYEIRYNQALDALARRDYVTAEKYFTETRNLAAAEGKDEFIRDMDARRAALYIQDGEAGRAIAILRPYTENGTGTTRMTSDYLMALRLNNQPETAIKTFNTYCQDWSIMPLYGLQTMGDIYMRLGDYKHAHELYSYVLEKNEIGFVRLGDAYALAILGKREQSMDSYRKALTANPNMKNAAAGDMAALLRTGHLHEARGIYQVLTENSVDSEEYQLRYGQALVENGDTLATEALNFQRDERMDGRSYYHEAIKVLTPLKESKNPATKIAAEAALIHNDQNMGRYATANSSLKDLLNEAPDHPEVMKVAAEGSRQLNNWLGLRYENGVDNKRNRESSFGYDYSLYLGGNTTLNQGLGYSWLQDGTNRASYRTGYIGLEQRYECGSYNINYDYFWGENSSNGYSAGFTYEFNDVTSLSYNIARRPHAHTGALLADVNEIAHTLRLEYNYGSHWRFGADYEVYNLSDDNHYWRWGVDAVRSITQKHNYRDNLIMNYSYGSYRNQVDTYDSPYRRVDYAAGISRKWSLPEKSRTWEWINMLGWGHDNDEGTSFGPWTRLEFAQDLPANQQIRIGAQYNWYLNQIANDDETRRNNGYLFDIAYYIGW